VSILILESNLAINIMEIKRITSHFNQKVFV